MDINQRKEQFSNAFVQAVASVAGFALSKPNVDEDSIDWTISARSSQQTPKRPKLDVQLKCTSTLQTSGDAFSFPLKIKNYDDLRVEEVHVPRILVVVSVPERIEDWLTQTPEQMILKKCGYWVSLRGQPSTINSETVTVRVPADQVFTPEAVRAILQRISDEGRV